MRLSVRASVKHSQSWQVISYSLFQDTFIGFGGNVEREKVKLQAPWFITDFRVLLNELQ